MLTGFGGTKLGTTTPAFGGFGNNAAGKFQMVLL
jgi:hypothetical protein